MTTATRVVPALIAALLLAACGLAVSDEQRMERAQAALEAGDLRSAFIELQRVLGSNPNNGDARLVFSTALLQAGQVGRAAEEYRRAVDLGRADQSLELELLLAQGFYADLLTALDDAPADDPSTTLYRAAALTGLGAHDAALEALAELKRRDPMSVDAGKAIARVHLARGDLAAALAELESMESFAAGDAEYWEARGGALLSGGRYEEAAAALERADAQLSGSGRTSPVVLAALVQANLGRGEVAAARRFAQRLGQAAPDAPGTLMATAQAAAADGNNVEAASLLQRLLADDPQNASATFLLGVVQLREGRYGQALAQFRSVLARHPEHHAARKLAAAAQMRMNQPAEALATLAPSMAVDGGDSELLELAGRANQMLGNRAQASELYARSAEQLNGDSRRTIELAAALIQSGDEVGAIRLLETIEEERSLAAEQLRISAHLARRDRVAAQAVVDRVAARTADPAALTLAGLGYKALGQVDKAEATFRAALRLDPKGVTARSSLAGVLVDRGLISEARELADAVARDVSELAPNEQREALLLLAAAGDAEAAAAGIGQLSTDDPASLQAKISAAGILVGRGFPVLAERLLDQLPANLAPQDQAAAASVRLSLGQADRALAMFNQAAAASTVPEIHLGQAVAQLDLGQRAYARATLESLLNANPEYVPALALLARVQQLDGDSAAALATAERVRQLDGSSAAADALRGDLLTAQNDQAGAAAAYRAAYAQAPNRLFAVRSFRASVAAGLPRPETVLEEWLGTNDRDVSVRQMLAQHYLESGEATRAIENYERLIALDAANPAYANNLAWLYIDSDPALAVDLAQRAYQAQPESYAIADTLGWALVKAGRNGEAVDLLRRAATLDEPEVRYHLAVALASTNARDEAKALFEGVLRSNARPEILKDTEEWLKRL